MIAWLFVFAVFVLVVAAACYFKGKEEEDDL